MRFNGSILHNPSDNAVVQIPVNDGDTDDANIQRAKKRVEIFAKEVLESLPAYWSVER